MSKEPRQLQMTDSYAALLLAGIAGTILVLNWRPNLNELVLGAFVGAVLSLFIQHLWSQATSPLLFFSDARRLASSTSNWDHWGLALRQVTKPDGWPDRAPAFATRVELEVFEYRGKNRGPRLLGPVNARWTSAPILEHVIALPGQTQPVIINVPARSLAALGESYTVYQGREEELDAFIKLDGDPACYLFSNESFLHAATNYRAPQWILPPGDYLLVATARCGSGSTIAEYVIRNRTPAKADFRLDPLSSA